MFLGSPINVAFYRSMPVIYITGFDSIFMPCWLIHHENWHQMKHQMNPFCCLKWRQKLFRKFLILQNESSVIFLVSYVAFFCLLLPEVAGLELTTELLLLNNTQVELCMHCKHSEDYSYYNMVFRFKSKLAVYYV